MTRERLTERLVRITIMANSASRETIIAALLALVADLKLTTKLPDINTGKPSCPTTNKSSP